MKKRRVLGIIISICLLLQGCGADNENTDTSPQESQQEETAWTGSSYMKAYQQFLESYMKEKEYPTLVTRATLAFIDDDNVPELLLIESFNHPAGVKVYTYYQESVIELGEFGSFGSMQYVEKGGMIFSGWSGMGEGVANFYQMGDGEAKLVCSIRDYEPFDGSPKTYEIDGVSATEEENNKKWEELYDAYEYVLIRYDDAFAVQESEITDLLDKAQNALLLQKDSLQLTEMVAEQSEVLDRYGAFLAEYEPHITGNNSKEVPAFSLIYLDGDDVPELVVIEGIAHACGGYVYTFEEGEVIPIGEGYGQYGAMRYWEKEGIVFHDYDAFGNVYCNVYQIEGKKETHLQSYSERYELQEEGEGLIYTYIVDGKEVSEEQYREVYDKWNKTGDKMIQYDDCRTLTGGDIRSALTEELENLILTQEEVLKQNVLIAAGAEENDILLLDYDDYDRDGKYEVFMICGNSYEEFGAVKYKGALYFAGADCCMLVRNNLYPYRMIDGKMEFHPGRKYLFFYTDLVFTSNESELWTVRDAKPVEESDLFQSEQVVYRGGNDFEICLM